MRLAHFSGRTFGARSIFAFAGLFSIAPHTFAECVPMGCFDVYIEELYPIATGGAWIKTSGNETLANCTSNSGVFLWLDNTTGYKEIYATLLAAQLADKRVSLRISEGSSQCTVVYVTLNRNTW